MPISLLSITTPPLPSSFTISINNIANEENTHDVKIYIGKEPNIQLFTADSKVLKAHSTYFSIALSSNWVKKSDEGWMIMNLPDISPDIFKDILNYLYNGRLSHYKDSLNDVYSCIKRIKAADELALDGYLQQEQNFLINNRSEWIRLNFIKVYELTLELPTLTILKNFLLGLLCYQPKLMFNSVNYIKYLDQEALVWLLKKDNLQMEEIDIWNNVILWGMIKCRKISSSSSLLPTPLSCATTIKKKIKSWSSNDWDLLYETLKDIIHLIRINNISTEDYKRKVKPFESLFLTNNNSSEFLLSFIKKNCKDTTNILDTTTNTSNNATNTSNTSNNTTSSPHISSQYTISHYKRCVIIDSTIVSTSHVGIISNWIKGKELKLDELRKIYDSPIPIPFYFKLLIRGSRDGFSSEIFHKWCDDYGAPTLIIIKLKNSLQIIGGFNSFSWQSPLIFSTFQHDKHAFIFSLCDRYGNKDNFKLARPKKALINDGWKALKFSRYAGPCFGKSDLQLRNYKTCYCKQHDYDDSITDEFGVFEIDDYEVFRVGFS